MPIGERRAVVLAAARVVFARVGLSAATIELIAREAGVSRQAVYEQFGDKHAVFVTVLENMAAELAREMGPPAGTDLELDDVAWFRRNFARALDYFGRHPDALALIKEVERGPDRMIYRRFTRLGEDHAESVRLRWAERGIDLGRMPELFITMTVAMLNAVRLMPWGDEPPDPTALLEVLAEFSAGGMAALTPQVISRLS